LELGSFVALLFLPMQLPFLDSLDILIVVLIGAIIEGTGSVIVLE